MRCILLRAIAAVCAVWMAGGAAQAESYAILYAGGSNLDENHFEYYNETMRMYYALLYDWSFHQQNIWIIHSDGLDPADDRQQFGGGTGSSDWTIPTGYGSTVLPATRPNLHDTITNLQTAPEDLFFLWTFDHGGGTSGDPAVTGEETLTGWNVAGNNNINDEELAAWCGTLAAERQVYVFGQCYSGGMLDNFNIQPGETRFGCAAANHYETSWVLYPYEEERTEGFIQGWDWAAEHLGYTMTHDLYQYAYTHDPWATDGEGPGGTPANEVEHPWKVGANLDMFRVEFGGSGLGGEESRWSNPDNWGGGDVYHMPNSLTTTLVRFAGQTREVTVADGPNFGGYLVADYDRRYTVSRIRILSGGSLGCAYEVLGQWEYGSMQHSGSGHNTVDQDLVLGRWAGAEGLYTFDGYAGGELTVGGALLVGDAGDGTFIHQSGRIVADQITLAQDSTGTGQFTQSGGDVFTTQLVVGAEGHATFTHSGGTVAGSGADPLDAYVGKSLGGSGAYTLTGNGALDCRSLFVGYVGTGHFTQDGGSVIVISGLSLGKYSWAEGTYEFNGGTLAIGQSLLVGLEGVGTFHHNAGTIAPGGALTLGASPGSDGEYTIQDGLLDLRDGVINVGPGGTGVFNLDGGTVIANEMLLGPASILSGGSASAVLRLNRLTGLDTAVTLDGTLEIGHPDGLGAGSLDVETGAYLGAHELVVAHTADATMTQATNTGVNVGHNLTLGWENGTTGTYELNGTTTWLSAYNMHVGAFGVGHVTQTDAEVALTGTLYLGQQAVGYGSYTLNGAASLDCLKLYVGYDGRGSFEHNGGTVNVNELLCVGLKTHNNTYTLNAGDLCVPEASIGDEGRGTFDHSGGTHQAGTLHLGRLAGSTGTYHLDGGRLESDNQAVGEYGTGTLTQTGTAVNAVEQALYIGAHPGGTGTYNLQGGTLTADSVHVGGAGHGELNWTGGELVTPELHVGTNGTVTGPPGTSSFGRLLAIDRGTVDMPRRTVCLDGSYDVPPELTLTGGSLTVDGLILGQTARGAASHALGVVTVGSQLVLADEPYASGSYELIAGTISAGTVTIARGGYGSLTQTGGTLTATGAVVLAEQTDSVGSWSMAYGTELTADRLDVGLAGVGTFTQDAGAVALTRDLRIGVETTAVGSNYTLLSGPLSGRHLQIGAGTLDVQGGNAQFSSTLTIGAGAVLTLTGGSVRADRVELDPLGMVYADGPDGFLLANTLSGFGPSPYFGGSLAIGHAGGAGTGSYAVGDDEALTTGKTLYVGYDGRGLLTQTAGIVDAGALSVGSTADGRGRYELGGDGLLQAVNATVGNSGTGRFTQTGGSLVVGIPDAGGMLVLGGGPTGQGTYELRGGDLVAGIEIIGAVGRGTMTQTGGWNTASQGLVLGSNPGGQGLYELAAGNLDVGTLTVGLYGRGALDYHGGTLYVTDDVKVGGEYGCGTVSLDRTTLWVGNALALQPSLPDAVGHATLSFEIHGTAQGTACGQIAYAVPEGPAAAAVGGTLVADFTHFTPAADDAFRLIGGFSAVTGSFDTVAIAGLASSFEYSLSYAGGNVWLIALTDGMPADEVVCYTEIDQDVGGGGSSEFTGGVKTLFEQTTGGSLTACYGCDPLADLAAELPPMPQWVYMAGHTHGQCWDIAYDGTGIGPATLTLAYDEAMLGPAESEDDLVIFHHDGIDWERLSILDRDAGANTLTVQTDAFSLFLLGTTVPPALLGDVNGDGVVDGLDIQPFVNLLTGGGYLGQADINADGVVDGLDIQPFVDLITGGAPTPEPASAALLLVGVLTAAGRRPLRQRRRP